MVGIIMSMGAVLAVVVIFSRRGRVAAMPINGTQHQEQNLAFIRILKCRWFWVQILDQNASRMISNAYGGEWRHLCRMCGCTNWTLDFALKSITYAKTAQETEKPRTMATQRGTSIRFEPERMGGRRQKRTKIG